MRNFERLCKHTSWQWIIFAIKTGVLWLQISPNMFLWYATSFSASSLLDCRVKLASVRHIASHGERLQHAGFCWGLPFQFSHTFSSGNTEPCCLSSCLTSSVTSPCHAHDVTTSWRQHTNLRRHRSRKKTLATCQWKKLATVLAFLWCLRCFCNDFHAHLSRSQELLEQTSGSSWIQLWHCPQSTGNIATRT